MSIVGELLLTNFLAYLINLAAGERSAAIAATREANLKEALEKDEALREALNSRHSIRDELRAACVELARNRAHFGIAAHEERRWQLLSDEVFQADLAEWLMTGAIAFGGHSICRPSCHGGIVLSPSPCTTTRNCASGGVNP